MVRLPEETLNRILYFAETRVILALGREPNAKQMLLEGGPCLILESILKLDGDIRSILGIKEYIPSSIALSKAVLTKSNKLIKRVCLIWNTWTSNDAFATACREHYSWAIQHLKPQRTLSIEQYNRIYFESGQLDKIDLEIEKPFYELDNTSIRIKAERLTFEPFRLSLTTNQLLCLYILKDMRQETYTLFELDEKLTIDLMGIIFNCLEEGVYEFPLDLYQIYGEDYGVSYYIIVEKLIKLGLMDALEYFQVKSLEIHRAVMFRKIKEINTFLSTQRIATLNVMSMYDPFTLRHYSDILKVPNVSIDAEGKWIGLTSISNIKFDFGFYDTTDDASIQATIKKIHKKEIHNINYFPQAYGRYAPAPRITLAFLKMHGSQVLDRLESPLYIVPYLTYVDIESTLTLLSILMESNYSLKKSYPEPSPLKYLHEKPSIFVYHNTIFYSSGQIDSHKCHLEGDVYSTSEFNDILFSKDIVIAFKTYHQMTS